MTSMYLPSTRGCLSPVVGARVLLPSRSVVCVMRWPPASAPCAPWSGVRISAGLGLHLIKAADGALTIVLSPLLRICQHTVSCLQTQEGIVCFRLAALVWVQQPRKPSKCRLDLCGWAAICDAERLVVLVVWQSENARDL